MVYIPKDDQRLPDFFTITINYLSGRKETLKVAEFNYYEKLVNSKGEVVAEHYDTYRGWTYENEFFEIPRASVESIKFGEEYTKIVMIERERKNKEANNVG